VPSAVVPFENNVLINVLHPDFARITIAEQHVFSFDSRLFE
jgi:RES domain-containing protein